MLLGLSPRPLCADAASEKELAFADALIGLGFPDYAEKLLNRLLAQEPDLQGRGKVLKVKILAASRKFIEAEALIKTLPAADPQAQSCWMAIANGYLQAKDLDKAARIYADFLDRNAGAAAPTAGVTNTVVMEAAYRLAQIREKSGDLAGAVQAYDRLLRLAGKEESSLVSKLQCAQANLYLKMARSAAGADAKAALEAAAKLCNEVIWKGVDFYFCQAVIVLAQIDLIRGDASSARKKLVDNKAVFQKYDAYLRNQPGEDKLPLSLSPMAAGLFFLGKIDQEQGEALLARDKEKGLDLLLLAFKELNAVAANYQESEWAPEAAVRAVAVRDKLVAAGKTVEAAAAAPAGAPAAAPGVQDAAVAAQMKAADEVFFKQTNYAQAQSEYLRILRSHPDTADAPRMLMNLARCYVCLKDDLMAKAAAGYLAERYAGEPQTGTMLLQIGKTCSERQNLDLLAFMYETFLANFPRHDGVPAVLFSLALIRNKKGDEAGAGAFMQRIINEHPNDPHAMKAVDQAAWWRFKERKYELAADYFKKFLAESRDDALKPQARFGLANCRLSLEQYGEALAEFRAVKVALESRLAAKDSSLSPEQLKKQEEMQEQTLYLMAFCLSRLDSPAAAVPGYQEEIMALADASLRDYPRSAWAPKMMSLKGTVQLSRGQTDQAVETFDKLAELYPESPEGKNALVSLVQAALAVNKRAVAADAFKKMKANKSFYLKERKEAIFAYLGRAMFDAGQYPEAIAAYQIVTASATTNKALLENAWFYLGRACCENTNYADAVVALNALLAANPQSGYYYDAKFALGRSYRGLGQYKQVYEALNDVATRATNMALINKASLELSKTQLGQGLKNEALASLMRVTLLADAANPELRPMVEEAFMESLKLQKELKRKDDLIDTCRQYLAKFPQGDRAAEVGQIMRAAELEAAVSIR